MLLLASLKEGSGASSVLYFLVLIVAICINARDPLASRRVDLPMRVGRLQGSGPCGFTNPLFPSSMVSEGSGCDGMRAR